MNGRLALPGSAAQQRTGKSLRTLCCIRFPHCQVGTHKFGVEGDLVRAGEAWFYTSRDLVARTEAVVEGPFGGHCS